MLVSIWLKIFNYLMIVQGLVILGCSAYIGSVKISGFFWLLFAVGAYVTFLGILGVCMLKQRSPLAARLYTPLLALLLLAHLLVVIGFLFEKDKVISALQDLNGSGDRVERIKTYIDEHEEGFKAGAIVVLIVELFSCILSVCARHSMSKSLDDELAMDQIDGGGKDVGLLTGDADLTGTGPVSMTPQTDARRAALNEKYGGAFERRRDYARMV